MEYLKEIIKWIKTEVKKAKAKGVIVGISGGIDSALVAYLAKKAFPNNSLGILMPINKDRYFDLEDGLELVKTFDLKFRIVDLYDEYQSIVNKTKIFSNLTKGNLQARLRMTTLYSFAQENNYLVLGTDNKAEYNLGYFTKWGDGGCDLLPIIHLYKSEVYDYAKKINVPKSILDKKPSAGLWDGQIDEKELGFSYDDYENYDRKILKNKELIKKIEDQIQKTNHKRQPIPQPIEPIRSLYQPYSLENWMNKIKQKDIKKNIEELIQNIRSKFPELMLTIKWNQLIFMLKKTFILGIGYSKEFINIAPEQEVVEKFKEEVIKLNYFLTKNLIKIPINQKINWTFITKIIKNNIKEKYNYQTFWR